MHFVRYLLKKAELDRIGSSSLPFPSSISIPLSLQITKKSVVGH